MRTALCRGLPARAIAGAARRPPLSRRRRSRSALWFGLIERLPRPATIHAFLTVDTRDAVRALAATPIVTIVSVLSLALGIGANTALFSILNSLVIKQLPVREPGQLVVIDYRTPLDATRSGSRSASASTTSSRAQAHGPPTQFNLAESGRLDPVERRVRERRLVSACSASMPSRVAR